MLLHSILGSFYKSGIQSEEMLVLGRANLIQFSCDAWIKRMLFLGMLLVTYQINYGNLSFFSGIQLQAFFGLELNQRSLHQSYTSEDFYIMKIKTVAIAKIEYLASTVILNKC